MPLDEAQRITESPEGLIALHEVLDQFAALSPERAELVKLRFFAGLSMPEAADSISSMSHSAVFMNTPEG